MRLLLQSYCPGLVVLPETASPFDNRCHKSVFLTRSLAHQGETIV